MSGQDQDHVVHVYWYVLVSAGCLALGQMSWAHPACLTACYTHSPDPVKLSPSVELNSALTFSVLSVIRDAKNWW